MMNAVFGRSGRIALLLGSVVVAYALGSWSRTDDLDYNPWAVD